MKINWKVRLKHKEFLTSLFAFSLLLVQQVLQLFGYDIGDALEKNIAAIFNTLLSILVLLGIVLDPTTAKIEDSERAMKYNEPVGKQ